MDSSLKIENDDSRLIVASGYIHLTVMLAADDDDALILALGILKDSIGIERLMIAAFQNG